ncbi:hypothetical protein ACUHGC_09485 [Testudinibacter sp. P27/CKL/0425]
MRKTALDYIGKDIVFPHALAGLPSKLSVVGLLGDLGLYRLKKPQKFA